MQLELDFVVFELASAFTVWIILGDLFTVVIIDLKFIDFADTFAIMLGSFDVLSVNNSNKALNIVARASRVLARTIVDLTSLTEDISSSKLYPKTP